MKKVLKAIGIVLGAFILIIIGFGLFMKSGLTENVAMTIAPVDLTKVDDGTYMGSYGSGRWNNAVVVTVANHAIADIEIKKTVLFDNPDVTNQLVESVLKKQALDVDIVSGATATSKVYLKSIKNALSEK